MAGTGLRTSGGHLTTPVVPVGDPPGRPTAEIGRPAVASHWTPAELATLAALAETFVRGGAIRRAELATAALDALDPDQRRELRLVLRLAESRIVNLVVGRQFARFTDMSVDRREAYLRGWAFSSLPLRRSAFQAYKKLLCFLAYADPGDGVRNARWAAIGYDPPIEPLTTDPTPIEPWIAPARGAGSAASDVSIEGDAVIVGSGAGGGVVAAELARAGRSVVVLEAGPFVPEPSMPTDELTAYDRLYLDHGLTSTWDGSVSILAGSTVGGGTTVNWMTSIAPPQPVRSEWASEHGIDGIDGPELDADLATLEQELGIQPPPSVPPKDAAILEGAAALGWEGGQTRRNGVGCGNCGSCPFGCRRGAKQSGLRVHLAEAWRHGARIVPEARVLRVLGVGSMATAAGVEARLADGRRLVVHAPQVVVAAGALRTPIVLEASGIGHSAVGRNLRLHPVGAVIGVFRDRVEMWSGTTQAARSLEFLEPGPESGSGFTIESVPGHPGLIALACPWDSADSFAELMARARHLGPFIAITRDSDGGRVRLTKAGRARIDYRPGPAGIATLRHGLVALAKLGRAAGASELIALGTPPLRFGAGGFAPGGEGRAFEAYLDSIRRFDFGPNRGLVFSAHQMGTARMGTAPADHVCDERGRVRSDERGSIVRGLYVADASLFPTAIGVNPMITTMLLARRVARTVLAEASAR